MLSDARVIRIETETDIERLRQVALLQRAELDRLYARLAALTEELAHARGEDAIAALQLELTAIREQLDALYRHLVPTAEALHALVLASPVIAADETRWPLLGAPGASKWHAWSVTSPDAISYRIRSSRSAAAAREALGDYEGIVVVDGYSAYQTLRDERAQVPDGPPFTLAFCWTHARRRFVDAEPHYPQATELIDRIADLYKIEARAGEAEPSERLAVL